MNVPSIRYAKTAEGVHVAYQVVGDGPSDLVWAGPGYSNIEYLWKLPPVERFLRRLSRGVRLIMFDPRGLGLSDPLQDVTAPTLETRMTDLISVMDAVGSEQAALLGHDATGPIAILSAATHPHRVSALVLYGTFAAGRKADDYPWGWTDDEWDRHLGEIETRWGTRELFVEHYAWLAPSAHLDDELLEMAATYFRLSASPGTAVALGRLERDTDVRDVLPSIHAPTLVMHRRDDKVYSVAEGRYLAEHIAGARFVELDGVDHLAWHGDSETFVDHVERFLAETRREEAGLDRVLSTIMFTDIVTSTQRASELGDRAWSDLLARHNEVIRGLLRRFRGQEVDTAGDGFLATFDGPARAVRCAQTIASSIAGLGLEVRAGVHTGEVQVVDDDIRGLAVHVGARVAALADASEVLVSSTVRDLVAGSGIVFEDRGEHDLKGVPDRWHLFAATG